MQCDRRGVLKGMAGMALLQLAGWPRLLLAEGSKASDPRFVFVMLRGALDGLAAVPAWGDPAYATARTGLAFSKPGEKDGALRLDDTFALHPRLEGLQQLYQKQELLVVHAVASPYRERSHFDGQNLLECGAAEPYARRDGWLGRALAGHGDSKLGAGLSIGPVLPLALRGASSATTWSPSLLPQPSEELVAQLSSLYGSDPALAQSLARARESESLMQGALSPGLARPARGQRRRAQGRGRGRREDAPSAESMDGDEEMQEQDVYARVGGGPRRLEAAARAAGVFLSDPAGPRVAMIEIGGWDTHAQQQAPFGALARNLEDLDRSITGLADALGPAWSQTVVLVATEFGRTVAMNGSRGTDHGTGTIAFVAGGAVKGGRVLGDWPGLAQSALHEGRDLRPTTDLRSVQKAILHQHLRVAKGHLESEVFPDSSAAKPLEGLLRA